MIDNVIMAAILEDEGSVGLTSTRYNFLVMTGKWRMVDDDEGQPHILATDNFSSPDGVLDVTLQPDCDIVDGERLIMYTRVLLDNTEFSLVVIKSQVYQEEANEADVG